LDTYTIESSCYGYEVKGSGNDEEENEIEQFTGTSFLQFGENLMICVCKHLQVEVTDLDRAGMCVGLEIETDYSLCFSADLTVMAKGVS